MSGLASKPTPIVTPAKAGVYSSAITVVERWIPAFAGMTTGEFRPSGCGYR